MRKLILLLTAFIFFKAHAQTPIQVNAQLLPPYSLQISDYYSPTATGGQKLNLILLNRDFLRSTINVRLRMVIESQGVRIATREDVTWPVVTLISGTPYYVTPAELASYFNPNNLIFSGISQEQYTSTGKLPEGFYTFCFETVEPATGLTVSNKGCAFAWITISDPPFLNIPAKAETVTPNASQNVNFQWTPRHNASPTAGYNTDYVFSITEVMANDFSPESAFTSHQALDTVSTANTMYNYGPAKPLLIAGRRYAWRVQAKAKQGLDNLAMFRNFGYSEVFWFDYKNNCTPPTTINAQVQGSRVTITWQPLPIYLSYKVDYREANNASAEWFTISTLEPTVVLNDLNFGKEYQYRVGASCEEESFNYSNLLSFTTGAVAVPVIANCGDSSAIPNTVPQTYLASMAVGDTILAGDFKVKILTISGSTSFTGTGTVKIPWLLGVKAAVRFSGIKVNTLKQLALGNIETTYDPKEAGIVDVDDVIDIFCAGCNVGNVITGQAGADTTVKFPIQWPGGITATPGAGYNPPTVNGPATITITGVGGTPVIIIVAQTLPITIMDSTGNIYQVNNTNPITVTLLAQGGGKTMLSKTNKGLIDADKAIVKFVTYNDPKVQYAFDEWNPLYKKSGTFNKEYEKISCAGGGDCIDGGAYYVSAKAIAPGKTDYLKATVTLVNNTINPDSIQFVNGKGLIYTKNRVDSAANVFRYEIAVVGGPEKDAQEIYALYPRAGSKTFNLGKVLVASYPRKEYNVKIVPVNGAVLTTQEVESVKATLTKVYGGVNVIFNVIQEANFPNTDWDLSVPKDYKLAVNVSGIFTVLTDEMKKLNQLFKINRDFKDDNIYLFVLDQAASVIEGTSILGDMPRGKQFGYIFKSQSTINEITNTVAHELGHGIFSLKHVFEYGDIVKGTLQPNNLMDYPVGTYTAKNQWDFIHDPAIVIGALEGEGDGMNQIVRASQIDFELFKNSDNTTISFLSEAETIISLPKTRLLEVTMNYGAVSGTNSEELEYNYDITTGLLDEFILRDVVDILQVYKYRWDNTIKGYKIVAKAKRGDAEYLPVTNGASYTDDTNINNLDGFIFPIVEGKKYYIKKFTKNSLAKYTLGSKAKVNFDNLTIKLFIDNAFIVGKEQIISEDARYNCRYCVTDNTTSITSGYGNSPATLVVDKIAQMRNAYPEYFKRFTEESSFAWIRPYFLINTILANQAQSGSGNPQTCATIAKPWVKYVCEITPKISGTGLLQTPPINFSNQTSTNYDLEKEFLLRFKAYVTAENTFSTNFWQIANESTSRDNFVIQVLDAAKLNLENVSIEKRLIALKKILDAPITGFHLTAATFLKDREERAAIKLLSTARTSSDAIGFLKAIEAFKHSTLTTNNVGFRYVWSVFDDPDPISETIGIGKENLTGVVFAISRLIELGNYGITNAIKINAIMDAIDPALPKAEQDLMKFQQFNSYFSGDNSINVEGYGDNLGYNEIVPIKITGSFAIRDKSFEKGTVISVPAIQARLFDYKNSCAVSTKAAWLAFDIGACAIGIGGAKILFTAGNWIQKSIVVADIIGSTAGMSVQMLNNDAISPELRSKIQIASLILSLPQLAKCIPKVNRLVTDLDVVINTKRATNISKERQAADILEEAKKKFENQLGTIGQTASNLTGVMLQSYNRLVNAGLRAAKQGEIIRFYNGSKVVAEISNNKLVFKYAGYGNDIIMFENKTTTIIGKWDDRLNNYGTKEILALPEGSYTRGASNNNGLNILDLPKAEYNALLNKNISKYIAEGKTPEQAELLSRIDGNEEFWMNHNLPFLDQAMQRGDNVRILSNNVYFKNSSDEIGSFYKREVKAIEDGWNGGQPLMQKYGYSYDASTFTYKKL